MSRIITKAMSSMRDDEVLRCAIPDGHVATVARLLRKSVDLIYKWRRERLSNENPFATGEESPLSKFWTLLDVIYMVNPEGAENVIEASREHLASLRGDSKEIVNPEELLARLEQSRNEINRAIRALKARGSLE